MFSFLYLLDGRKRHLRLIINIVMLIFKQVFLKWFQDPVINLFILYYVTIPLRICLCFALRPGSFLVPFTPSLVTFIIFLIHHLSGFSFKDYTLLDPIEYNLSMLCYRSRSFKVFFTGHLLPPNYVFRLLYNTWIILLIKNINDKYSSDYTTTTNLFLLALVNYLLQFYSIHTTVPTLSTSPRPYVTGYVYYHIHPAHVQICSREAGCHLFFLSPFLFFIPHES